MQKIKLFCFPYAGGSSVQYSSWKPLLKAGVELIPIELAGRGRRMNEPLYKDLNDMIEDVFGIIKNQINDVPFAFFGHSMGALVAFELTHKLRERGLPLPIHLFFSGRRAPHLPGRPKHYHKMDPEEFKNAVIDLGGTPPEFFESPELVELFVPLMRNDFMLAESTSEMEGKVPFDCGLTIFIGKEEDITAEEADGWKHHTSRRCSVHYFNGGHFFLHEEQKEMMKLLNQAIPSELVTAPLA